MKRSTITIVLFSTFSFMLWSCTKEAAKAPVAPQLPTIPYTYAAGSNEKMALASLINICISGIGTKVSTWGGLPPVMPSGSVTSGGATLGRVIFHDNVTSITINNNCKSCHNGPIVAAEFNGLQVQVISAHASVDNAINMAAKMKDKGYYAQLFTAAYGTPDITPDRITDALAQYMAAMASVGTQALATDQRFANPFR